MMTKMHSAQTNMLLFGLRAGIICIMICNDRILLSRNSCTMWHANRTNESMDCVAVQYLKHPVCLSNHFYDGFGEEYIAEWDGK